MIFHCSTGRILEFAHCCFKNASAGTDLKQSLLDMLNKTKDTLVIPDIMTIVNIVMIPKPGKKSLSIIQNQRGIFLLSVRRTIIIKMLRVINLLSKFLAVFNKVSFLNSFFDFKKK